jgi:hypothetical protein
MRQRRFRLAVVGVLALTVTVGLLSGGAADAKKKKKGKSAVTVTKSAPTVVPPAAPGPEGAAGVAQVPLRVGKKAKGKVVGWDSLTVTTSWSSAVDGALNSVFGEVIAPNGRTVGLVSPPFDDGADYMSAGPITETPNSPVGFCANAPGTPPPPPCSDPDNTLTRPYSGTVGNVALAFFGGNRAKGTWIVEVKNFGKDAVTLNSVSLHMTLKKNPPA